MDLDSETWARLIGAICKQAIREYHTGDPGATALLWAAGLLRADGTIGRPTTAEPVTPLPAAVRRPLAGLWATDHPVVRILHVAPCAKACFTQLGWFIIGHVWLGDV